MTDLAKAALGPLPKGAAAQHVITLGKTRSGKSSKLRVLIESALDQGIPAGVIDPKGDWWGIKSSASGKRAGYKVMIFGGSHADFPIDEHTGGAVAELVATDNLPFIIDLGGWMPTARTKFFVDFASKFFIKSVGLRILAIDECHNFAPQGKVLDPLAGKALHWANRLASEGAGKGITLFSASQRPQKVHKDYVTSHETLIACRVVHNLDRGAIKDWIDGCGDPSRGTEVIKTLASLNRKEAWVWSPEIDFGPERVEFPMFKTFDSFAPRVGKVQNLKGWASIDVKAVTGQIAALAEKEKANNPDLLRKTITDLTAERDKLLKAKPEANPEHATTIREQQKQIKALRTTLENAMKVIVELNAIGLDGTGISQAEIEKALAGSIAQITKIADSKIAVRAAELDKMKRSVTKLIEQMKAVLANDVTVQVDVLKQEPITIVPRMPAPKPIAAASGDGTKMKKAERSILIALAQYGGNRTKKQIAVLTGYAINGGGFNNALGALRSNGFIDGADQIQITPAGVDALGTYDPLPTGAALLDHWMGQLKKAEREVLAQIARVYPQEISKDDLAAAAGYAANGGGFNNALGRLRTLELISGSKSMIASENLFG